MNIAIFGLTDTDLPTSSIFNAPNKYRFLFLIDKAKEFQLTLVVGMS